MKRFPILGTLLLTTMLGCVRGHPAPAADTLIIEDVSIIPMDGNQPKLLEHRTLVVAGGRIMALGESNNLPATAGPRRVDGRGLFLLPGLFDMHVHVLDER